MRAVGASESRHNELPDAAGACARAALERGEFRREHVRRFAGGCGILRVQPLGAGQPRDRVEVR
jgi:hypothetical protein